MLFEITSAKNPRVKRWKALTADPALRRETGLFPVDGEHMVREALAAGCLREVLLSADSAEKYRDLAAARDAAVLPPHVFRALSDTVTPQGIMGFCAFPDPPEPVFPGFCVALNAVQDPGNVGTVIRTMDAAGLDTLLIDGRTADPWSPKCVRATMGGIFRVRIRREPALGDVLRRMRAGGCTLAAGLLDGGDLFSRPPVKGDLCVLIGSEGRGLDPELAALADLKVRIPMPGGAESLNASVSAAILIYDFLRERL